MVMKDAPSGIRLSLVVLALAACASSGRGGSDSAASSGADVLSESQLADIDNLNAFEALQRLRPMWLRQRGVDSFGGGRPEGIRVYVDGVLEGGVATLRAISVRNVSEIRFLDSRQATLRFGTDHGDGAILVRTG
ncbi:MAG: hypothetical protein ACRELD_08870 [Longimicrobiales bacterium]